MRAVLFAAICIFPLSSEASFLPTEDVAGELYIESAHKVEREEDSAPLSVVQEREVPFQEQEK